MPERALNAMAQHRWTGFDSLKMASVHLCGFQPAELTLPENRSLVKRAMVNDEEGTAVSAIRVDGADERLERMAHHGAHSLAQGAKYRSGAHADSPGSARAGLNLVVPNARLPEMPGLRPPPAILRNSRRNLPARRSALPDRLRLLDARQGRLGRGEMLVVAGNGWGSWC